MKNILLAVFFFMILPSLVFAAMEKDFLENDEDYALSDNTRNPGMPGTIALGDINGDGYDDLIMGAPQAVALDESDTGIVYVRFGLNFGEGAGYIPEAWYDLSTTTTQTLDPTLSSLNFPDGFSRLGGVQINGERAGDRFGASLATGDFDGDGICDIAVGMEQSLSPEGTGRVYMIRGRTDIEGLVDLATERIQGRSFYITGRNIGDRFGEKLFFADFNNDGKDDLVIGSSGAGNGGEVDIFYGRAFSPFYSQGVDSLPLPRTKFESEGSNDQLGSGFAKGDLTGNGLQDLAIGAPGNSGFANNSGMTYIFEGTSILPYQQGLVDLAATTRTLRIVSRVPSEKSGSSLASGDFDQDGLLDLAIGAPGWGNDTETNRGRVYVFYNDNAIFQITGTQNLELSLADIRFSSLRKEMRLGSRIAFLNFDDYKGSDLVVAAPFGAFFTRPLAGEAWIIQGHTPSTRLSGVNYFLQWYDRAIHILGQEPGDNLGFDLCTGDFNGDGTNDLFFSGNQGNNSYGKSIWGLFGSASYQQTNVKPRLWNNYE